MKLMCLFVLALPDHIFENIDNLTYNYNGNQVESINDTGTDANYTGAQDFKDRSETSDEYDYDNNGNMSKDLNKNINKISYNYINLPDTLQMRNGHMLTYGYDAAGNKTFVVRRTATGSSVSMPMSENLLNNTVGYTVASTSTSMYLDNIVYEDGYLMKVLDTDGILLRTNTRTETTPVFKRNYYIKDHLGNIRVVFDENGIINQVNHYYPFGMEYGQEAENQTELKYQDYLFGGKEFDRKYELNTYDFGARFHDATRGQWTTPDPLAEKYYSISPYVYCGNNPLRFIDPTGNSWRPYDVNGKETDIKDYGKIQSYRWVDYDTDKNGNKVARANTVETAYTFGLEGMTTLTSENYKPQSYWQAYSNTSTGDELADANISTLDPRIQDQMKAVVLELRLRNSIDVRGSTQGGFRTYSEQDAIYDRGASKAKGGQSNHNFAIAMDVAIFEDGKYLSKGTEWQYATYGNVAKKRGLMWGGDWKSFYDPAHIEYKHNLTTKQLRTLPRDKRGYLITLP